MTIREKIDEIMNARGVEFKGAEYLEFDANNTKVKIYDMNYTTYKKTLIGYYVVPFNNFIRA